ncbi:hypothetical protein [Glycocaulis alkaliphilus]|uniref:hypothetical protein n=1 Tax=Glycocaulis alkaliphilus TaxID=1434191 RepID=UPI000FD7DDB9|nr:hypothetical protein [Glycocaulis alkaliphilus]GGB80237.1 hypothetical protein GCM10007417_20220 [Glycocaulis alkaliphilus]
MLDIIAREADVIQNAPISFLLSVIALSVVFYFLCEWRYAPLRDRLSFRDEQIAALKEKFPDVSAPELVGKVEEIRTRLNIIEERYKFSADKENGGSSGDNANGYYTRYKDGTMVCKAILSLENEVNTVVFPAEFIGKPSLSISNEDRVKILNIDEHGFRYRASNARFCGTKMSYVAVGFWN